MGLLDSIIGSALGGQGGGNPLLQAAIDMIAHRGASGTGDGLGALLDRFRQNGLGQQADSWVGTGQNLPISADQIAQVLGNGTLGDIAERLGLSHGDVAGGLSQLLPDLIDRVTPNGQLPASADLLQNLLGAVLKR